MDFIGNDDAYLVFEGSDDDDDEIDSSDDDVEDFWVEFEKTASRRQQRNVDASDFEQEMNKELDIAVNAINESHGFDFAVSESSAHSTKQQFYDDIYFDSDSDGETEKAGNEKRHRRKHPVISNDDLLYDPNADDEDQEWVNHHQRQHAIQGDTTQSAKVAHTDAVLNCPACMTTLCRDCQRHELYKGQYRAMFVSNCKVDSQRSLKYPQSQNKKKRKSTEHIPEDAIYNPVHCCTCNTQVAVYDADEVYHFFNVLASYA